MLKRQVLMKRGVEGREFHTVHTSGRFSEEEEEEERRRWGAIHLRYSFRQ
jgi:hypothetical protein